MSWNYYNNLQTFRYFRLGFIINSSKQTKFKKSKKKHKNNKMKLNQSLGEGVTRRDKVVKNIIISKTFTWMELKSRNQGEISPLD